MKDDEAAIIIQTVYRGYMVRKEKKRKARSKSKDLNDTTNDDDTKKEGTSTKPNEESTEKLVMNDKIDPGADADDEDDGDVDEVNLNDDGEDSKEKESGEANDDDDNGNEDTTVTELDEINGFTHEEKEIVEENVTLEKFKEFYTIVAPEKVEKADLVWKGYVYIIMI